MVRDRPAGLRAAGLDPDARPGWRRSPAGTRTASAADLLRRRPAGQQRPVLAVQARRALSLGSHGHRRSRAPAASHPADQTEQSPLPRRENTRAGGTPPARRDSRAARRRPNLKISTRLAPQATTSQARKVEARRGKEVQRGYPVELARGRARGRKAHQRRADRGKR
jgi:hypothetical protein